MRAGVVLPLATGPQDGQVRLDGLGRSRALQSSGRRWTAGARERRGVGLHITWEGE